MCLKKIYIYIYILVGFIHSLSSPSPLWTTSKSFILLFSYMDTKHIHHIHPHSPFPCAHPTLTPRRGYPPLEKIYFSLLPFIFKIKCTLIVQGDFILVLQACIYRSLLKLPSCQLLTLSLSPCSRHSQQLVVQCIGLYSHTDGLLQYFSFSNISFLSPTSHSPLRQTH
jgi:hypothetical protein